MKYLVILALFLLSFPAFAQGPQVTTNGIANGAVTTPKLSTTGVTSGTYGDSSHFPVLSVGVDGRLTLVTLQSLSAGPSGTRGSLWYTGSGAPGTISGVLANDEYLDTATGNVYTYTTSWAVTGNIKGATGAAGSTGATGTAGPAGSNGTNGTNGAAATIAVGTTTTGAAGTSASVTNSGTSSAATFNFTIPQGATGAAGATGPAGIYTVNSPLTLVSSMLGINLASGSQFGAMEVGAGLSVSAGVVSLPSVGTAGTYAYPSSLTQDAYGRVSSITAGTAPFAPASVSAPSTVTGAISDYSGTTAYTTWQASFSADVAGESGGDTQWQWSTDGATWMGPGGTSATWYYVKGSHWRNPVGYTSGNLYAQARNVNAAGSVSGAVSSASLAYAVLGAGSPFGVTIVTSLPTPSSAYRGRLVDLSGQPAAGSAYYTANTALSSLKNWWRMNDASGSAMTDVIGSRNGTYTTGDTYHQTAPNSDTGAYSVTAATTTGNVLAGTVASGTNTWAGTGGNTIVAWVNCYGTLPSTFTTSYGIGVGSGDAAGNAFCLQFSGGSGSNAGVAAYVIVGSSVAQAPSAAPYYVTFPNTGWHMLSATLDGTNLKLYIDGALSSTTAYAGYFTPTPTVFNIAPGKGVGVSEVSTYNAALTLAQIQSLYNAGNGIGTDDKFYVCIEQAAGTYAWKYMTLN